MLKLKTHSGFHDFLKETCQPLKESGKAGILVAEILHDASDREVSRCTSFFMTNFNYIGVFSDY
jgi:hypothetical protein